MRTRFGPQNLRRGAGPKGWRREPFWWLAGRNLLRSSKFKVQSLGFKAQVSSFKFGVSTDDKITMEYRKLSISITLLIGILTFGTLGYYFFEDMTLFESFYMTLITISTVGFSEIKPLTPPGRIITIVIIVTGISVGTYTIGMLVRILVEGELR